MSTEEKDGRKAADQPAGDGAPELADEQLDKASGGDGSSKDAAYMPIKLDPERLRDTTEDDDPTVKLRKDG